MSLEKYSSLPIAFEQVGRVADDRYIETKIWIAHTGENRNGSAFSREVLTKMAATLPNTPVLGYIDARKGDFKGHEERITIENDNVTYEYIGQSYGVIPESCNPRFEERIGEDGVAREYLTCNAVLWTMFEEVGDIFDASGGVKNQSMELYAPSIKGNYSEGGIFHFTDAKFRGACILGDDVTPAMVSSTIEKFSASQDMYEKFSAKLAEFNAYYNELKGGENVETVIENVTEIEEKVEEAKTVVEETIEDATTIEEEIEAVTETEDATTEPEESTDGANEDVEVEKATSEKDVETKVESNEAPEATAENSAEPTGDFSADAQDESETEHDKFELSHNGVLGLLIGAVERDSRFERLASVAEVYDDSAIILQRRNNTHYRVNYSLVDEQGVVLGDATRIHVRYLTEQENARLDFITENFEALEVEVKEYRAEKERAKKEEMLSTYEESLTEEEYKTLYDQLDKFSVDSIDQKVGLVLVERLKAKPDMFSVKEEKPVRIKTAKSTSNSNNKVSEGHPDYGNWVNYR